MPIIEDFRNHALAIQAQQQEQKEMLANYNISDLPFDQYANGFKQIIETNPSPLDKFQECSVSGLLQDNANIVSTYSAVTNTGECFLSSASLSAAPGIYRLNRTTKIFEKLTTGPTVNLLQMIWYLNTTVGELFVTSNVTANTGIYRWDGTTFVLALSAAYHRWFIVEDNAGNIFASAQSAAASGIWKFNNSTKMFDKVYAIGSYYDKSFIKSTGEFFLSSSSGGSDGVIKWDNNANTFVSVYPTGRIYVYYYEDVNGELFVSSNQAGTGCLHYDGTNFVPTSLTGYAYTAHIENEYGHFMSSGTNSILGCWWWNGSDFVSIIDETPTAAMYNFTLSLLMRDGTLFMWGIANGNGIWRWDNTAKKLLRTNVVTGYYTVSYQDFAGNAFVASANNSFPIQRWNGTAFVSVGAFSVNTFYEKRDHSSLYCGTSTSVQRWNGTNFISMIPGLGQYYYEDAAGNLYATGDSIASASIVKLVLGTAIKLAGGNMSGYSTVLVSEDNPLDLTFVSRTSGSFYKCLRIINGVFKEQMSYVGGYVLIDKNTFWTPQYGFISKPGVTTKAISPCPPNNASPNFVLSPNLKWLLINDAYNKALVFNTEEIDIS